MDEIADDEYVDQRFASFWHGTFMTTYCDVSATYAEQFLAAGDVLGTMARLLPSSISAPCSHEMACASKGWRNAVTEIITLLMRGKETS